MTMSTFKRIAVTNRSLCSASLKEQVEKICNAGLCNALILREKDLAEHDYMNLAMSIKLICDKHGIDLFCNNMPSAAERLGCNLQLSYQNFLDLKGKKDQETWVSVHTVEEARNAEKLGADGLIAGHIFVTDCKKGLAPRGLDFLKEVCDAVSIPVFAIGGIDDSNSDAVRLAGAQGECRMSWYMRY